MTNRTEHFIKGSNNLIELQLTENDAPILGAWNTITLRIGRPAVATITRTSPGGNGIEFGGGFVEINPGLMSPAEVLPLENGRLYPIWITIESSADVNGVDFGGPDTIDTTYFLISARP